MKKLFIMIAAVAAVAFTACTGNDGTTTTVETTEEVAELTPESFQTQLDSLVAASDTAAIHTLIDKAKEQVEKFVASGDTVTAKTFHEKVAEIINTNKERLIALAPTLKEVVTNASADVPVALRDIVSNGVDSLSKVSTDKAKEVVKDMGNALKEDTKDFVDKGKKGAEELQSKADNAQKKVNDFKESASKVEDAAKALMKK